MRSAREHGLRVVMDLVVNHTSNRHPWFDRARRAPKGSSDRDWYVWSEKKPKDATKGMIFPGEQESVWSYDKVARAWYMHRFYEHQPDLNVAHPAVRDEIRKIMGFWLELGVSGFRIDAAPFVVELKGIGRAHTTGYDHRESPPDFFERMREFLQWRRGDAILLAEANIAMDEVPEYVGEGDRLHLLFHFFANQHLFLAMATGEAEPLVRGLTAAPPLPRTAQWAQFLRLHDELDLGRLTEEERERVAQAMAPEERMWAFERGPRRRLMPMLGGDRRRYELATSLMLALPGSPVLHYGDEIGMGEDLRLKGRNAVRTPMQWSPDANAGFSTAAPDAFPRPLVAEGPFAYPRVNVRDQTGDPDSLLQWTQRMVRLRRTCPEIGWGAWSALKARHPAVLALVCEWHDGVVLTVHNLSGETCEAALDLSRWAGRPRLDLLHRDAHGVVEEAPLAVALEPFGYRWFRIGGDDATRLQESTT
jgi:maltose alpha-D-glucosyltransferase/alpha-amylase